MLRNYSSTKTHVPIWLRRQKEGNLVDLKFEKKEKIFDETWQSIYNK